ncbi:MAG: T9SS type A sorting domain-containing protein [Flavobacteriales bacterium]|nr:T9SS type A sorting domain-containing protein [Flavobacteriales bacterium]MBP6696143.1 T9SS type A sorting domain-containing protein [Flavobacteriales bacterium]
MKKVFSLLLFCCAIGGANAQQTDGGSGVIVASGFHITRPLSEIFAENPVDEDQVYERGESEDRKHREPQQFPFTVADGPEYGNDPSTIQDRMGEERGTGTRANWVGQTASGFRPYDPSGAVGPNHYVQMINSTTFKVYNKATGTVLLTGTLGNLWSPATANNGDPVVMYDKAADRWFLSQFGSSSDRKIYIAVSTTNDPTGSYYTYTYVSPQFPDYLKFGVWQDGYYMTSNQSTQKVFCFERTAMLAGTPGARSIYVNYSPPKSGFFVPLAGDAADGTLPPAGTPCPIFSYSDNGWGTGYFDRVNIYQMAVNWVPATPTASITLAANVSTAAFDASYNASWNDVSQPGTTQKLDGIGGVCMYRAQWKTWSGHNSVVLNWAVRISSTQRSIKWCELRQSQATGVWSMYQEGIYAPDANTRWMGAAAMDNNGSIGITYLKSNSTSIYPGLYYTGRRTCDPLGTLPVTEVLGVAGTGSQTGVNRVGDYAQTTLDPDGVTFWSTGEYMGGSTGSSAARTRIISYQIPTCGLAAGVAIAITGGSNPSCAGSAITFTATPTNGGTTPAYQWKVNGTNVGTNASTYSSSSITNGQVVTCVMTSNLSGVTGNPATSNAITITISAAATPAVAIAQTTGSNPTCAGASVTFTATPTNGGSTPAYQWKVNGVNAGTNSAAFTTTTLTNGQIVSCVLTSNLACATTPTATSNSITMGVNPSVVPSVAIAITAGSNPSASGASVTFTATPTNGGTTPAYQWKVSGVNAGTNSATFTTTALTNGQIVTCVLTSNATCAVPSTATSNGITMTITGGLVYCTAGTTNTTYERITNVTMGSINNTSGASSYSNYTSLSTNVVAGVATPISVTIGVPYSTDKVYIWCDWNRNGTLTNAGEAVYASAAGVGPFNTTIIPPVGTTAGPVRMRIRLTDSAAGANATPCGNSTYGEVEDYTLNVTVAAMPLEGGNEPIAVEGTRANEESATSLKADVLTVFPNPSRERCTITATSPGTYYLMNDMGILIRSFTLNAENSNTIQLDGLSTGTYVISGQTRTGIVKQKLIVAQ